MFDCDPDATYLVHAFELMYWYTCTDIITCIYTDNCVDLLRKPASWLVAVCERSENRGLGGLVDSEEQNLAVRL